MCVFSSCRSALMQHVFRPKNFTLVASSSLWDPSLSSSRIWFGMNVCVCASLSECLCVFMCSSSPPWPRILHSAQLRMHAQAPHCAPFLWKRIAIDFECFVREKGNMCQSGGRFYQSNTRPPASRRTPPPLSWQSPELPSNKRETRGGARTGSTVSLICQEGGCQGSTASVVHYYWRGLSDGGRLMAEQGAS